MSSPRVSSPYPTTVPVAIGRRSLPYLGSSLARTRVEAVENLPCRSRDFQRYIFGFLLVYVSKVQFLDGRSRDGDPDTRTKIPYLVVHLSKKD